MWNKRKRCVLSVACFSDERFIQRFNKNGKDLIEREWLRYKRLKEWGPSKAAEMGQKRRFLHPNRRRGTVVSGIWWQKNGSLHIRCHLWGKVIPANGMAGGENARHDSCRGGSSAYPTTPGGAAWSPVPAGRALFSLPSVPLILSAFLEVYKEGVLSLFPVVFQCQMTPLYVISLWIQTILPWEQCILLW